MQLSLVAKPFDNPDWLFEWKADGFRALAYINEGSCNLVSRKDNTYKTFANLSDTLAKLEATAILDGEIVCLDEDGRSLFMPLLARKAQASFYAFDLLWLVDKDLRGLPLFHRKQRLQTLLRKARLPGVICASHIEQHGIALYQEICQRDLEGIVCKRKDSIYSSKSRWLKIKNPDYTQAVGRREMFERFRG
jgi:bifunctional non-homologous end joining protein LigD